MSITDYINSVLPYAQSASNQTGLPLDYVLAQSAWESGWGTSQNSSQGNNYFGISPGGTLATYPSVQAGFNAYASLINNRYSSVLSGADLSSPQSITQALVSGGYNTADPNYTSGVSGLVPQIDAQLQALGINPQSGAGSGLAGSGANPAAQQSATWSNNISGWLKQFGLILVAIVVLGGGLFLLARKD